jgi:lipopolysaccharide export system permease protein
MRLLDRYLLRELLIPLGYCLGGFMLLWVSADLFARIKEFQEKKLLPGDIAALYLVTAPETLVLVFPIALLLALLYALSNHARNHEITAIRAAGVSIWRLCLPYLSLGFVATLALFAVNEFWVPTNQETADQILARHQDAHSASRTQVRGFAFRNASAGRDWQSVSYNTETGEMSGPTVTWRLRDGARGMLKADVATPTNGGWRFCGNVSEFRSAAQSNELFEPVLVTNELALPFSETPEEINSEIRVSKLHASLEAKRADIPISDILNYLRLHPNLSRTEGAAWLQTKLQGRLAAPWTCLVVVLIAIPFGAASGRRNVFVGVAASILICFSYFILQQVGLTLGSGGHLAPWLAAWFPNLAFGLSGLWMTARVR